MNKNKYSSEKKIYYDNPIKKLIDKMLSDAKTDTIIKKVFYPNKNINFNDVVDEDNIYLQIISKLFDHNLKYYIKNLEIVIKEPENIIIALNYIYYNENETISETNIKIYYDKYDRANITYRANITFCSQLGFIPLL